MNTTASNIGKIWFFREEFEPCKFFGHKEGEKDVWLTREQLRNFENGLKNRFVEWLKNDRDKLDKFLTRIGRNAADELECRSHPFDQVMQQGNGVF